MGLRGCRTLDHSDCTYIDLGLGVQIPVPFPRCNFAERMTPGSNAFLALNVSDYLVSVQFQAHEAPRYSEAFPTFSTFSILYFTAAYVPLFARLLAVGGGELKLNIRA